MIFKPLDYDGEVIVKIKHSNTRLWMECYTVWDQFNVTERMQEMAEIRLLRLLQGHAEHVLSAGTWVVALVPPLMMLMFSIINV